MAITCPFAPMANGAKITIRWQKSGQNVENVFWAHFTTLPDVVDLQDLADAAADWASGAAMAHMPIDVVFREATVIGWSQATDPVVVSTNGAGSNGTMTGYSLPNNVTVAVHKDSGARGRGQSGRAYWPGLSEDQVTATNTLSPGAVADIIADYENLANNVALLDNPAVLVVPHAVLGGVCLSVMTYSTIQGFSVRDLITDSQRGRLPARGR